MASATSAFPLASESPTGGNDNGSGSANAGGSVDDAAGASGSSPGAVELSHGALVAIIIVVVVVALLGSTFRDPSDWSKKTRRKNKMEG